MSPGVLLRRETENLGVETRQSEFGVLVLSFCPIKRIKSTYVRWWAGVIKRENGWSRRGGKGCWCEVFAEWRGTLAGTTVRSPLSTRRPRNMRTGAGRWERWCGTEVSAICFSFPCETRSKSIRYKSEREEPSSSSADATASHFYESLTLNMPLSPSPLTSSFPLTAVYRMTCLSRPPAQTATETILQILSTQDTAKL